MTLHTNSITNAIYSLIGSDSVMVSSGVVVDLYQPFNSDPDRGFWVNVSPAPFLVEGERAQVNEPWLATYNIPVFIQVVGDPNDVTKGLQDLDVLTNRVFLAVNSDRSLLNTVENLIGFDISPFELDIETEDYIFTNQMNIAVEVYA